MVKLEGYGKFKKNAMILSVLEHASFWLVA
jgi:hypothetical protein